MKKEEDKDTGLKFAKLGGEAFKSKYGSEGYRQMIKKRWDKYHGRVCMNCGLSKEEIEKKKLRCEIEVEIIIKKRKKFADHVFNVPVKKPRKPKTK